MLGENLNKLKQFESVLKQCLIKRFGSFLPENKLSLLNNTEYIIGNEFTNGNMDRNTIQGNVLRNMLDSLIDITCLKEISLDGINTTTIVYGRDLEDGIIEYYVQELAKLFKINVNEKPELKEYIDLAIKLKQVYGDRLDYKVFVDNAIKLLNISDLKELSIKCDENAVSKYLEKTKALEDDSKENDTKLFDIITSRSGSVQIIYLNEKKYIKYIDMDGKIHLVQSNNSSKVDDFYKSKISSLGPGEELDPEAFFKELCEISSEETLTPTEEINEEEVNFDQSRMIRFIDTSEKLEKETVENVQEKNTITHSNDSKIHAINGTDKVVYTDDKETHIDANIVSEGQNHTNENSEVQNTDIGDRVLTQEEYNELCMRYANNEELSEDELKALMMSTPDLMDDLEQESGPKLSFGGKKKRERGFANKTILIYILMVVAFIGVFIGAMIFSMTN